MAIPQTIHQIWTFDRVPTLFECYSNSWRRYNPHFQYKLWDWPAIDAFIYSSSAEWRLLYESFDIPIQKLDMARYAILAWYGGIYADFDFECVSSVESLLEGNSLVFGYEPVRHNRLNRGRPVIGNAWIAGEAGHEFWHALISSLTPASQCEKNLSRRGEAIMKTTGPLKLTEIIESQRWRGMAVYSSDVLFPKENVFFSGLYSSVDSQIAALDQEIARESWPENTIAIHHWAGIWARGKHIDEFQSSGALLRHELDYAVERRQRKRRRKARSWLVVGWLVAIGVSVLTFISV